jgi:hypothetical protein
MNALEGQMEEIQKRLAILGDQPKMLISHLTIAGGEVTMGDKRTAGRDYFEKIGGHAQVTTGASGHDPDVTDIRHLKTKEALQDHYQLLSEKLADLRKAYILETDTEVKFKLKKNIETYEADLTQIEERLEALEHSKETKELS